MRILTRLLHLILVLLILCISCLARVETVRFQSKLINTTLPYNVIVPPDYDTSKTTRYPVLYLLHGFSGHYSDWVSRSNVADYASDYRMIVVMPEGNDSWYTDSVTITTDKYETYILNELIPDVQQRYRTIEARYGRSIAGLSMGGYGAIKFGLKSPATFVFAASMSGAFMVTRVTEKEVGERLSDSLKLFGPFGSETRAANDLFAIIEKLPPARMVLCLISTSTAALKMYCRCSYHPIANSPRSCSRRRSRTSFDSFPAIIHGPTGTGRFRRF